MATTNFSDFLRRLTRGMAAETLRDHSDQQLVERALAGRDEAPFQAVVHRHGPMVYRVCWRILHHSQDAEDAFQATFLILAQRLRALRKQASLASWLHGVAHYVALKAKANSIARHRHERRASQSDTLPSDDITRRELRTVLDSELNQLPDKWRLPLILCYMEGRTQEESASQLGWSKSTLRRRLDEARTALAGRLTGRGIVWPAALFAMLVSDCVASAAPAPKLVASTVQAATNLLAGKTLVAVTSAEVAALTEGFVIAMLLTKLKTVSALLLVGGVLVCGSGLLTYGMAGADQGQTEKPAIEKIALKAHKEDPHGKQEGNQQESVALPQEVDPKVVDAWKKAGAQVDWYVQDDYGSIYGGFRNAKRKNRATLPAFHCLVGRGFELGMIANLPAPVEPFALVFAPAGTTTDEDLRYLVRLKSLQALILRGERVTDIGLKELASFKNLRAVDLCATKVTDAGLKELAGLKFLQHLDLNYTEIRDEGLKELAGLKNLQTLDLGRTGVTGSGLKDLAGLKSLQILVLFKTNVTDANLKDIAGLMNLQTLNVGHTKVTDSGLKELAGFKCLKTLRLDHLNVTDGGLKELRRLESLENLYLDHTMVTDRGLKELARLRGLQTVYLGGVTEVTDAGLKDLTRLKSLESLNLDHTRVTDAGIKELVWLKNLQYLDLRGTRLTDSGLVELARINGLQHLNISVTNVTDAGLRELTGLKNLQTLNLRNTKVTAAGIAELWKALPNVRIER